MKNEELKTLELDLSSFERPLLEFLIVQSCEQDISINKLIENLLTEYFKQYETSNV